MRPTEITAALECLIETRRPCYIWGEPGVGKSSIVHALAKKRKLGVLDLRAVLLDPVDLRGLPTVTGTKRGEKVAEWCPPAFLPLKGKVKGPGIIFADELAQAPPLVQASFMQGILDHRIGEAELDPSWTWIAASNRQQDRAGAHRLLTPLLNRFIHFDLEVSGDDWNEWAISSGIDSSVRSFLRFKPALLHGFDANSADRAFPTPRSWEYVSSVLQKIPQSLRFPVISGCIGAAATEFLAFLKLSESLPTVDDILKSPKTFKMFTDPGVLYALSGALVDRVRGVVENQKLLDAVSEYVIRMPLEYATLTIRDAGLANTAVYRTPCVQKWMETNKADLL